MENKMSYLLFTFEHKTVCGMSLFERWSGLSYHEVVVVHG